MKTRSCRIAGLLLPALLWVAGAAWGEEPERKVSVKTNAVAWATATPNVGVEFPFKDDRYTFQIFGTYHPFTFKENRKLKHWLVQPELRRWTGRSAQGHFFGVHLVGGQFNAGGINMPFGLLPDLETHRYEGWGVGAGLSYGYKWRFGGRWGLEASVGVGYARLRYDTYPCEKCGGKIGEEKRNYFGPTKAAISIIYNLE